MPQDPADLNWSRREPLKAGLRVQEMVLKQDGSFGWRHAMAARGAQAYSQCGLGDLWQGIDPYSRPGRGNRKDLARLGGWQDMRSEAHARAACETLAEKLVGLRQTKGQMVGTDLPWEKRRQGVWADRFSEGVFHLPQGTYLDTWDAARQGFLLAAAATGTVFMRTEPDYVSKRVNNILRSSLQTFIDPGDWGNGKPLSYFDVTWENPEYLAEDPRYSNADIDKMWKSAVVPPFHDNGEYDGVSFGTKMVKLVSCWRMPFGKFKGRQAQFVGAEKLLWEDWEYPEPPIAAFRMNRCLGDPFWSENLIEIMLNPLLDAQDIDNKTRENMKLLSQAYVSAGSKTKLPKELLNALNVNVMRYDPNNGETDVKVTTPPMINEQYLQYRDRKITVAQQLSGVPLLHSSSDTGAPNASGRSKRLEAGLMPERFGRKLRDHDHWLAVDITRNNIRAARQIGKVDPDWQVTWPGVDFDAKVSVKVLDIDDSIYELRPYPVSEQKNTPADRMAAADEMLANGEITKEQHTAIASGVFDTPKETKGGSVQRRYVSRVLDEMQYGAPELIEDEAQYMSEKYLPPPPWLDAAAALSQAFETYLTAYIDGVPQNRRVLMRSFLEDLQVLDAAQKKADSMQGASVSLTGDVSALGAQTPPMGGPIGQGPGPQLGIAPPAPPPAPGMGMPPGAPPPGINVPPGAPGIA